MFSRMRILQPWPRGRAIPTGRFGSPGSPSGNLLRIHECSRVRRQNAEITRRFRRAIDGSQYRLRAPMSHIPVWRQRALEAETCGLGLCGTCSPLWMAAPPPRDGRQKTFSYPGVSRQLFRCGILPPRACRRSDKQPPAGTNRRTSGAVRRRRQKRPGVRPSRS